jgi:hypothetical protein
MVLGEDVCKANTDLYRVLLGDGKRAFFLQ